MSRIARLVISGYPHHIIMRGNNKEKIFFREKDRKAYLKIAKIYTKKWECDVLSYCLMPNHIHLLVVPPEIESLSKVMQAINLTYTQYINKRYNRTGRIWGSRFHSSIVDKDEYLWRVIRYIETNPVRADMIENPADYFWSSGRSHLLNKKDYLAKDINHIIERCGIFDGMDYEQYLKTSDKNQITSQYITKRTLQDKPIGSESFLNRFPTFVTNNKI